MSIYTYHLLKGLGLSEQRVIRLLPTLSTRNLEPEDVIWPKSAVPSAWAYIETGFVSACIPAAGNGLATPVNIYGQGTWFGEAAVLNHQAANLEYVCLTPARVIFMPLSETKDAFEQEPDFARYIARMVTWRNQQHADMLGLMHVGSPSQRVVLGLALFAEALISSASHLPTAGDNHNIELPLNQSLLASLCGGSRGIFSECVQQLTQADLMTPKYATLTLRNIDIWKSFSHRYRSLRYQDNKPSMPEILAQIRPANGSQPSSGKPA